MMEEILSRLRWQDGVELLVLWGIFYRLFLAMRGTIGVAVLKGLSILVIVGVVAQVLGFETISFILRYIFGIGAIGVLIVFQPELRRALARIGRAPFFGFTYTQEKVLDEIVRAASYLSENMQGGLIVLERQMGLDNYADTGVRIDGMVSADLLTTIFTPHSPLHDGAVIVRKDRVVAAGCILPLADVIELARPLGMRHRAALGVSVESDAVCIVVSEETGAVSLAIGGKLTRNLDRELLERVLKNLLMRARRRGAGGYEGKKNRH